MKEKTDFRRLTLVAMAVGALVTVSCGTDDSIDLNDIDSTLGFQLTEFTLPGNNSTHEIVLQELFDIDTTGCIKIDPETGQYVFRKEGNEVKATNVKVNPVKVADGKEVHPKPFVLSPADLGITLPGSVRKARHFTPDAPESWPLRHVIQTFNFDQPDVTGDVVDLHKASIAPEQKAMLKLDVKFSPDLRKVLQSFSGFAFKLPPFLKLDDNDIKVINGEYDPNSPTNKSKFVKYHDSNIIEFRNIVTKHITDFINNKEIGFHLEVPLRELDFSVARNLANDDYLVFTRTLQPDGTYKGRIQLKGNITVLANYDPSTVVTDPTQLNGGMVFQIDSELHIDDMNITSATGRFGPSVDLDNLGDISIGNDVPDFLNDPDVQLEVDNPIIRIDLESTLPINGFVTGELTPTYKKGVQPARPVTSIVIPNIVAKKNSSSTTVICESAEVDRIDKSHYPAGTVFMDSKSMGDVHLREILQKIPEHITFSADAKADDSEEVTVLLDHDYTIKPAYSFEAKLALNAGSRIVYNDSIDGWKEDLEDIDLGNDMKINIEADVVNNSPMQLNLKVTPVGALENGKREDLDKEVDVKIGSNKGTDAVITSSLSGDKNPTKLTIQISSLKEGAFKKLDGIRLKAWANMVSNNTPLVGEDVKDAQGNIIKKSEQTLQLKNIKVKLSGSVQYDPDKDDKK